MTGARPSAGSGLRRLRRKPGENRSVLIQAGTVEFGLRGFSAAQTSAIARRAGISQPNVYANFASKQDLFLACLASLSDRDDADLSEVESRLIFQAVAATHFNDEFGGAVRSHLARVKREVGIDSFNAALLHAAHQLLKPASSMRDGSPLRQ